MIVFQQMIVLCDSQGVIDMTPPAISRRTNIPLDIIEAGIEYLEKPDPYSRSQKEEGRRIVLIDDSRKWGWRIVNHKYYRDLASKDDKREKDRIRIANKREQENTNKNNDVAECRTKSQKSPIQDTYTDTLKDMFIEFYERYPRKQKKKDAEKAFMSLTIEERSLAMVDDLEKRFKDVEKTFIPYPATYLRGGLWTDEIIQQAKKDAVKFPRRGDCEAWVSFAFDLGLKPNVGELQPSFERRIINYIEAKQ
jgi:hypothetical protein